MAIFLYLQASLTSITNNWQREKWLS